MNEPQSPTPIERAEQFIKYLNYQFEATNGHIPIRKFLVKEATELQTTLERVKELEAELQMMASAKFMIQSKLDSLVKVEEQWNKDATQHQKQVEEARSKNLPHEQMLSMMTALRACANQLATWRKENEQQ